MAQIDRKDGVYFGRDDADRAELEARFKAIQSAKDREYARLKAEHANTTPIRLVPTPRISFGGGR